MSLITSSTKIIGLFLFLFIISSCPDDSNPPAAVVVVEEEEEAVTIYQSSISIPLGGNAYQTAGSGFINISENGVSFWSTSDEEFSAFVYSDADKTIRLDIEITTQTD